jgi:hypothetical protein
MRGIFAEYSGEVSILGGYFSKVCIIIICPYYNSANEVSVGHYVARMVYGLGCELSFLHV